MSLDTVTATALGGASLLAGAWAFCQLAKSAASLREAHKHLDRIAAMDMREDRR